MKDLSASDHATIVHIMPGITEVRFHANIRLTTAMLAEVMRTCRRQGKGPDNVVVVFPEYMDFDPQVMLQDQHVVNRVADPARALAIVCQEHGLLPLIQLYFAYYPPVFMVEFCDTVEDARHWLDSTMTSPAAA